MHWFMRLLSDRDDLNPQVATGSTVCTGSFLVWATVTWYLAATGKQFVYYDAMTTGAFGMFSAGAGLLGWHLKQQGKSGEKP